MKETQLSTCEKQFVLKSITEDLRLDDNRIDGFREFSITFGNELGCCEASLGETKILCQVSCEIVQPKISSPNEGLIFFNVELSPMSAPHFDIGRHAEVSTRITRLLERNFKDSNCVDLESLCIVAEEKVWNVRVDLHVLNYAGSVLDCCSIAALASLMYFCRPDVTMEGDIVTVHPPCDRDPIPLSIHHTPIICSFAVFPGGKCVPNPSDLEERVMEGEIVIGMNTYREICCLHVAGATTTQVQVISCAELCHQRAQEVVSHIKEMLKQISERRNQQERRSFAAELCGSKATLRGQKAVGLSLPITQEVAMELPPTEVSISNENGLISATPVSQPQPLEWGSSSDSEVEVQMIQHIKADEKIQHIGIETPPFNNFTGLSDLSDDDEEEVVTLPAHHIMYGQERQKVLGKPPHDKKAKGRGWYPDRDW